MKQILGDERQIASKILERWQECSSDDKGREGEPNPKCSNNAFDRTPRMWFRGV